MEKNAVVSSKVKNKALKGKDLKNGTVTPKQVSGIPKAWANVSTGGAVTDGEGIKSSDITVSGDFDGFYCFNGIGGATAQVTGGLSVDILGATAINGPQLAAIGTSFAEFGECPAGTTWLIITHSELAEGKSEAGPFSVVFFD